MVSGHRLGEANPPIKSLNYIVLPAQIYNPLLEHLKLPTRDMIGLFAMRTPQVFAANGIETGHYGSSPYTMVLNPKSIVQTSIRGGPLLVQVKFITYIARTATPTKRIWEGEAYYEYTMNQLPNEQSVDAISKVLLAQLVSDGVVKLDTKEISTPSSDPQLRARLLPDAQNVEAVPLPARDIQRRSYETYLTQATPRAYVICRDGHVMSFSGGPIFIEEKLTTLPEGCAPYAVNDAVVWN